VIVRYLAEKIIAGELGYGFVIGKRPDLKAGIDEYLIENGYGELII